MKKLVVLTVFGLVQAAFALQAPYLYTADSATDTTVQLTWRNNSTAYQGIVVLRKAAAAGQYGVVDTVSGSVTAFTDIVRPPAQTTYYYALTAYSLSEHADTSNADSVGITPPKSVPFDSILRPPLQLFVTWDTATHACQVTFNDSSNVETGHRVYRSTNFGPFQMVKDMPSLVPQEGYVTDTDATVSPNSWNIYRVDTYKGQQTLSSALDTVFTFDINAMKTDAPNKCAVLGKIGSFPIKYGTWSIKSGDTIVLDESGAPDSTFSIIDVSNPSKPRFAGTGKAGAAAPTYGWLPPAYASGKYLFAAGANFLSCYEYHSGMMQTMSSVDLGPTVFPPCGFLSDTELIAPYWITDTIRCAYCMADTRLWAEKIHFENGLLSHSGDDLLYDYQCGATYPCNYTPGLIGGVVFQKRLFTQFWEGRVPTSEIVDYNFSPPKLFVGGFLFDYTSTLLLDLSLISNGISIDLREFGAPDAILIDTVKNLVFALSDTEISIYNCKITTGVSHLISSAPRSGRFLHVGKGNNGLASVIFLPPHAQPASISIFDISGRRISRIEGIRGETVAWPHQNRAGVYIVRAMLDGSAVSAKVVLTK